MKYFILISIIFIFSCTDESKNSDPCDVMCDNCIGSEQCEECYENCYNNSR